MDFEFWVYIVGSPSGTLYVGMTGKSEVREASTNPENSKAMMQMR